MPAHGARTSSSRICRSGSLRLPRPRAALVAAAGLVAPWLVAGPVAAAGADGCGAAAVVVGCGCRPALVVVAGCRCAVVVAGRAGSGRRCRLSCVPVRPGCVRPGCCRLPLAACSLPAVALPWSRLVPVARCRSRLPSSAARPGGCWSCCGGLAARGLLARLLARRSCAARAAAAGFSRAPPARLSAARPLGAASGPLLAPAGPSARAARWPPPWAALMASTARPSSSRSALIPRPPAICFSSGSSSAQAASCGRRAGGAAAGAWWSRWFRSCGVLPTSSAVRRMPPAPGCVHRSAVRVRPGHEDVSGSLQEVIGLRLGVVGSGRVGSPERPVVDAWLTLAPGSPRATDPWDATSRQPRPAPARRASRGRSSTPSVDEGQHRRSGTGDDGRDARARAASSTRASDSPASPGPVPWCRRSSVAAQQHASGSPAERGDEQGRATGVGRRVGVRHLRRAAGRGPPRCARRPAARTTTAETDASTGALLRPRRRRRPGREIDEAAEQGRGDVVGVALDPVGERESARRRRAAPRRRRPGRARARARRRSRPRTNPARGRAGSGCCSAGAARAARAERVEGAPAWRGRTRWLSSRATSPAPSPTTSTSSPLRRRPRR